VQPIEPIDHDINGGIESERRGCGFKIVVDGFGDADAIDAGLLQLLRCHQRAVTSYDDQRFDLKLAQDFFCVFDHMCRHNGAITGAGFPHKMAAIRRADDGATQRHDSINAFTVEDDVITGRK
jgi:hypothetical protein